MKEIIDQIDKVIAGGKVLLSKPTLRDDDLILFKKSSYKILKLILAKNINETITELAERGLEYEVKRIRKPFYQWIFNQLNSREAFMYGAPFIIKHSDSDYFKKYIFGTNKKLEGIVHNLKLIDSNFYNKKK